MRIAVEMVEALRYKLRCFGVPIDGPTEVLCDNKLVVTNSSVPASTLMPSVTIEFARLKHVE